VKGAAVSRSTVRIPASTANLGSGYDAFGLALARYNSVTAELVDAPDEWSVTISGEGVGEVSTGHDNLVVTSMRRLFFMAGEREAAARIACHNDIPFGRGLGSSSAAIVGGLVAGNALLGRPFGDEEIFRMAAEIEGHPDNVAAALAGGFTLCWSEGDESRFAHVDPPGGLAAVIVVSEAPLSTKIARDLLPRNVPHTDAAFDVGRAGLLATGIVLGLGDLIGPGMNDRLHEQYRAAAVTDLDTVREALLAAGADGAALSGAGPTIIGLVTGADDAAALARAGVVAARAAVLLKGGVGRRVPEVVALDRTGAVTEDA
jgi:homoserine kinase